MPFTLTFWGATRTVTGSLHCVQHDSAQGQRTFYLDCGLFQGRRQEAKSRNCCFPTSPADVEAVILSHAHIDHSGNLPNLVKQGFQGKIYATPATIDLCQAMLRDSAFIQQKDAEYLNRRRARRRSILSDYDEPEIEPLYSIADAERALELFVPLPNSGRFDLGRGLHLEIVEAGHMLGSVSFVLSDGETRLGFSGDIGRANLPIIRDPQPLPACDYLIMESTYGDRFHDEETKVLDKLADIVNRTAARGGRIISPAFAVGRTQQIVLLLNQLSQAKRIPNIPIFVDSPLAVNVTEVFREHQDLYDAETAAMLARDRDGDVFGFHRLRYIRDVAESKALNDLRGPMMIISASGMAESGRIIHHLRNTIGDPRNTVLITGFQAENTLGRKILEGHEEVPIFGEPMRLRAEVAKINELSGHADQGELLNWLSPLAGGLKKVFLVHGEARQQTAFVKAIYERFALEALTPERSEIRKLS
ncbi:MAG: MBL fold metallo-hydrolase [Bryobacter sp.]|nr:MBL fold metallo-hydrolase [Bryobacter sp.]